MKKFKEVMALCFDDILMVPQQSDVVSRKKVDLSMYLGVREEARIKLSLPIIAAPMDTVCEENMAIKIAKMGGLGIIHRYVDIEKQLSMVEAVSSQGLLVGASVGATDGFLKNALRLEAIGAKIICVDIANGHSSYAINAVKQLRKRLKSTTHIMSGNVSTKYGYFELLKNGADSVRVGIGGGAVCTTRQVSGHGVPTLQSVIDCCVENWEEYDDPTLLNLGIIADGGIRNTGDMVKAFAAGASAVMLGSLLSGHEESPGALFVNSQGEFKEYRGMASKKAQEAWRGHCSVSEGVSTLIPYKGSIQETLNSIRYGIGSGCSYSGVEKLSDLTSRSQYVTVSTASLKESQPHAKGDV
jgi:IMP dehydrogenase